MLKLSSLAKLPPASQLAGARSAVELTLTGYVSSSDFTSERERGGLTHRPRNREACPICHREVVNGEAPEWAPVCPLLYPEVEGLLCHARCLDAERERNRVLRREDLQPTFLRRRS